MDSSQYNGKKADNSSNGQSMFDDDDDEIFELPPCSQQQHSGVSIPQKRTNGQEGHVRKKKAKIINKDADILKIDPDKCLKIHNFICDYDSDQIVKEYVDILLKHEILPIIPDQDELEKFLTHTPSFELNHETQITLVKNFMSYFQTKYFQNNVNDATNNRVPLFNPVARLSIPGFQLLPEKTLKEFTNLKKVFAIQYQHAAKEGSELESELLILRNINLIMEFCNSEDSISDFSFHFATTFLKSRMEFMSVFKLKNIDWNARTKKSKITHSNPKWRKENKQAPNAAFNMYSKKIESRINEGKESFNGTDIRKEYTEFMSSYEEKVTQSNRPKRTAKRNVKSTKIKNDGNFTADLNKLE